MANQRHFNEMNRKATIPIRKEIIPFLGLFVILSAIFYPLSSLVSIIFLFLAVMIIYFFRDPDRRTPQSTELIVSPADGYIEEVKNIYEDRFIKEQAIQISIVLSIFDVHITRSPIEGENKYFKYEQGKNYPIFFIKASLENTRSIIGIQNKQGKVLIRQIAGAVARRVINFVKEGDKLQKGQRIGLIVLGSRTEIVLPQYVKILIKKGEKVKAGETVLALWEKL